MSLGPVINVIVNFWRDKMNRKEKEKVQIAIYNLTRITTMDKNAVVTAEEMLDFLVELKPKEFD